MAWINAVDTSQCSIELLTVIDHAPKPQCDTPFRQECKQIVDKYYGIQEDGSQEVKVTSREGQVITEKVTGMVYADAGPYIECNPEDLIQENLEDGHKGQYYDVKKTKDKTVEVYVQKKTV